MSPTAAAQDTQDRWYPVHLIELVSASSPSRFVSGNRHVLSGGNIYVPRVLGEPVIERQFSDTFWGWSDVSEVSFLISNHDDGATHLYTTDLRGSVVLISRLDLETNNLLSNHFIGTVTGQFRETGAIRITAANPDPAMLEEDLPKGTVTTDLFHSTAVDVGARIPVISGNVLQVRCPYVRNDTVGNLYDYLVGRGALTVPALYRNWRENTRTLVNPSEYVVETTRYTGFTTVRFTSQQLDYNGALHEMYADVNGLSAERNFARMIRTLLSDSTWGLGRTVDATSFNAAEAALDAIGDLYCDGVLSELRKASEILRDLMMVRGMRLSMSAAGAWQLTVDQEQTQTLMDIGGGGTGDGHRNLLDWGARSRPSVDDQVSTYTLGYRVDPTNEEARVEISRVVSTKGGPRKIVNPFIMNDTTADKTLCYLAKREELGNETIPVTVTQEGRKIVEGNLVRLTCAPEGYASTTLEVRRVEKSLNETGLVLGGWSADFYIYTPAAAPTDPGYPSLTDLSRTPPATPTGLAVATGVYIQGEGTVRGYLQLSWNANSESHLAGYEVGFRRQGETPAAEYTVIVVGEDIVTARFDVEPNKTYDIRLRAVDIFGHSSAYATTTGVVNADTIAPDVATGLSAAGGFREITLTWTKPSDPDLSSFRIYRHTSNDSGAATLIADVSADKYVDKGRADGTTYYYWVKSCDTTGNLSGFSAVASAATYAFPATPTNLALSSVAIQTADGTTQATLDATWDANVESDLDGYELHYKKSTDTAFTAVWIGAGTTSHRALDVQQDVTYQAKLRAISIYGLTSSFTGVSTVTSAKDVTAPSVPSSVAVDPAGKGALLITYTAYTEKDFDVVEVWRATTNSRASATKVGEGGRTGFLDSDLADDTTYYYWLRSRDLTGNLSAYHAGDAAGSTDKTLKNVPYRFVADLQLWTGLTDSAFVASIAVGVDRGSDEIDIVYVDDAQDVSWAEATIALVKVSSGFTTKFAGTYDIVSAVTDTNNDLHLVICDANPATNGLNYARLDANGTVEQAAVSRFGNGVNADKWAGIAHRSSSLFYAWLREGGANNRVMFGITDLSGTVTVGATQVAIDNGVNLSGRIAIAVDSESNSHILWCKDTGTIRYAKMSSAGTVLIAATSIFVTSDLVIGAVVDAHDEIHLLAYQSPTADGRIIKYARLKNDGSVLTPLSPLYTKPNIYAHACIGLDTRNDDLYLIQSVDEGTTRGIWASKFAKSVVG